jgi:glucose/arabinose dehydrogenase
MINDFRVRAFSHTNYNMIRYIDPSDITLPPGYNIEVFAQGLDTPIAMKFSEEGNLYIADSGITSGQPKVLQLFDGHFETIAADFVPPITGINILAGDIYVTHRGYITVIRANGARQNIISGLPCNGDFLASNVAFGPDGKIYFGQGTATNSGVVGTDNQWVFNHPLLHDVPAFYSMLSGQNFETNNMLSASVEKTYTGAFSPYGVPNVPYEIRKGMLKASGCILKANRDGTDLELVAGGLRNPVQVKFNREYRLYVANRGYDVRGSRPIANAPDEFHQVQPGAWYGWPDFSAGEPVSLPKFKPEGGPQPEFLLMSHPGIPPVPFAVFSPHTTISGFDFNNNANFGNIGDVYIAEHGSFGPITMGPSAPHDGIGHRISQIDMSNGIESTFINNKSGLPASITGEGGLGRPVDVVFGPDGAMYIVDIGISDINMLDRFVPYTGVIWKVTRTS